jgi:hypothetical protein
MITRRGLTWMASAIALASLVTVVVRSVHRSTRVAAREAASSNRGSRKVRSIQDRFRDERSATTMGDAKDDTGIGERDGFDAWFEQLRAYPAGAIPVGAVTAAFSEARLRNDDSDEEDAGNTWEPLGPSTIPNGQTDNTAGPALSPVSGRLTAIAVHPHNPDIVYAAGAQGGVWKTTNASDERPVWKALTDHQVSLAMGSIAIDPVNPNIVYAGTGEPNRSCDSYYGRGILRSSNGGRTWVVLGGGGSPLNNSGPFVGKSVSKIIIDPATAGSTRSTTLWASTTIGVFTSGTSADCITPSGVPFGLWRSTDSGATWQLQNVPSPGAGGSSVHDLAIDPTNRDVLYVAVRSSGVWKSVNATAATPAFALANSGFAIGSAVNPIRRISLSIGGTAAPGTLYAAVENNSSSRLFGLYKTVNGGATWSNVDNGFHGTAAMVNGNAIVTRVSGPSFVTGGTWSGRRFIVDNQFSRTIATVVDGDHLKLTATYPGPTGTSAWSTGNYPVYCDGQCFYDMTVAVDAHDGGAHRLYVGGNPHTFAPDLSGVAGAHYNWRSDDGGGSWTSISQGDGVTGGTHTDDHAYAIDSFGTLYDGNDGGIWRSTTNGASWTSMNTNIAITQFQGVSTHPSDRRVVLGGTQDNGTNLLNPAVTPPPAWFHADFGDGGQSLIDQSKPSTMYHTYFNQSFNFMGPAKSSAGGTEGPGGWPFVGAYYGYGPQYYNGMNPTDPVSFYAPLAQNPAFTPNVIYFGSDKVYRSPDPQPTLAKTPSWTAVSPPLTKGNPADFVSWISAFPRLIGGKEVLYTGASDGRVAVSSLVSGAGIAPWSFIDKPPLPNRSITGIALDARDRTGNTAYVAVSGFNANTPTTPGHVFKTTTGRSAGNWLNISGDLPDIPVNQVILEPRDEDGVNIYVASDIGVFRSRDGGEHWRLLSKGLPFVTVFGLERNATTGEIVASTHGRGMFRLRREDGRDSDR